ncbi:MAG: HAD-superfamily hydrolase [Gammaproteobacteria bacterium]|jgi:beta-phosphoglucomutase|nr:HAD-superfamily hydrolase [Gammaproteobacteria bacterium]
MKFKAIIFDFDGVLFDSEKIHLQACNQVFKDLGFTISEDEYFQAYVGLSDNEMFDLILKNKNIKLSSDQVKALRKRKIIAYKDYVTSQVSLDGVRGVKEFLEIHAKIIDHFAICSGATREEIEATLRKLEQGKLRIHFKHIISIDDIKLGKPSPEGYLLAANRLNVLPPYCLAIEDTPVGIAAAKAAGMTVVGIATSHEKKALKNADFVADSYNEINSWIKEYC